MEANDTRARGRVRKSSSRWEHGGLLAESRRRQADVTEALAKQVFEAVEVLVAGFEAAAGRDVTVDRIDWLRAALEEAGDHLYQGVLSVVLRLVFLLYAEDQSLLPVEHPSYAEHLSLYGLYRRLSHDAGAHPESMHHRFGVYGQLLSLFRSVFFGVKHGSLELPARRGRLFDPNAYPFLEGGLFGVDRRCRRSGGARPGAAAERRRRDHLALAAPPRRLRGAAPQLPHASRWPVRPIGLLGLRDRLRTGAA